MYKLASFGALILGVILFSLLASSAANFDPEIDGFGKNWKSFATVSFDGYVVKGLPGDIAPTVSAWQHEGFKVGLWLGASQLHTISNGTSADKIAVYHANKFLEDTGTNLRIVELSYGNGNLLELLAAYLRIREEGAIPDFVIVAVTYDDMREPGVRRGLVPDIDVKLNEVGGPGIRVLSAEIAASQEEADITPVVRNATSGTPQEKLEKYLTALLEENWPAYRNRGRLQGMLEILAKQRIARIILGRERRQSVTITAGQEDRNFLALDSLRRVTYADGVRLFVYRAPLRKSDNFSYYDPNDYRKFEARLSEYCREENIAYRDLDDLVPSELYGMTNSGLPDYFHFNERGHEILGKTIADWVSRP